RRPPHHDSAASGRRAYRVSDSAWSASRSARPPPICPSPTIPTRRLVKRDLSPNDPRDQIDELAERLHRVSAREPRQLAGVDAHVVLLLQLLEQGEEEERIEPEIVEEMRVVAHLFDVPLELVGEEPLHLRAHLRALRRTRRSTHLAP